MSRDSVEKSVDKPVENMPIFQASHVDPTVSAARGTAQSPMKTVLFSGRAAAGRKLFPCAQAATGCGEPRERRATALQPM